MSKACLRPGAHDANLERCGAKPRPTPQNACNRNTACIERGTRYRQQDWEMQRAEPYATDAPSNEGLSQQRQTCVDPTQSLQRWRHLIPPYLDHTQGHKRPRTCVAKHRCLRKP